MHKARRDLPQSMIAARNYYNANATQIDEICTWLSDDKSVRTFRKLVSLRQFYSIKDIPEHSYTDQYFPGDIMEFANNKTWREDEVFVDCGAFNGDICVQFAERAKKFGKIYAFEPDRRNVFQLRNRSISNIEIVEAACSNMDGIIKFCESDYSGGSHMVNESLNYIEVPCVKIDTVINDRVDFIKMDIEGAEMLALQGAQDTIKKYRPKLAISIYHSNEDMIDIPEYIHKLVPEYRLFVRAHTMGAAETVLYCVV